MMTTNNRLLNIFETLLKAFGKRNWWPGDTVTEVMIGAILTQNTAWKNVEKAIYNMKERGLVDFRTLYEIDEVVLAEAIRPSGFFNIKSKRLKNFIKVIYDDFGGIDGLAGIDTDVLRKRLLEIKGIGPETADSILLYALERPVFVVDAYTKRFLANHGLFRNDGTYHETQRFFMENLPHDTYLFNEFHALIVCLAQQHCKKVALCQGCPLENETSRSETGPGN